MIIVIIILIIFWIHKICIRDMWAELLCGLSWNCKESINAYLQSIYKLGIPDIINKKAGGVAIWENWNDCYTIKIRDTQNCISNTFPIYWYPDYRYVDITDKTIEYATSKINKISQPIIVGSKKVTVESSDFNDVIKKTITCIEFITGTGCGNLEDINRYARFIRHREEHL
jgi:hypothetical protein